MPQTLSQPQQAGPFRKPAIRIAVVLLLFSVAGLATLAKNAQYLPKSNSVRYISCATKMKAAQSALEVDQEPLRLVARVIPVRPAHRLSRLDEPESPPIQLFGLTVSPQHRSPPLFAS
jgi:hypothetical protein